MAIVDSTLREGEQGGTTEFSRSDRLYIAKTLDKLGVEYIEMVNPVASSQAASDCYAVAKLGLKAKILAHTRCHMDDVRVAVDTGVAGVNIYMATSSILRQHSHGKGIDAVIQMAEQVIAFVKKSGLEVRFSCEDTFRSDAADIIKIYSRMSALGVDRVGIADTVGVATPMQVYETVKLVRSMIEPHMGIEFHTHNDTGCAVANALMALEAGATHIDTSVLGVGERNGITPLGGFLARLYSINKEATMARYDLKLLRHLDKYVAQAADVSVPFNNYVTGSAAFTHKAGVHSKAVMTNPDSYEILNPADFGVERRIQLAHRLTGWNAMKHRCVGLGLDLSDDQIKAATITIKNLADTRSISLDQVDGILMNLSHGPRTSSSLFMAWNGPTNQAPHLQKAAAEAAAAVAAFEAAAAQAAVSAVAADAADKRPTMKLKVQGHLFDKAVLNRILDICVDSDADFEVLSLDVAQCNEHPSTAVLQLWADKDQDLVTVHNELEGLIRTCEAAECTLRVVSDAPGESLEESVL